MDAAAGHEGDARANRACFLAAVAVTVGWFLTYDYFRRDFLVDESGHLGNVYHFLEGKAGWPEQMTMLPGYHFIVAALWQLHPPLTLLTLARVVTMITALLGLAGFALAWQSLHGKPAGRATLLCALLPLLQPFAAMAYTDVPAIALVLVAFAAQLRGQFALAAGVFVVAALVRQTNLLWAAFAVAYEFLRPDAMRADFFRRTRWLIALLGLATGMVLRAGRFTIGTQTGTTAHPNIGTLHCAAWLMLLLVLPIWIAGLPELARRIRDTFRSHSLRGATLALLASAAAVVFTRTFANPHIWNRELFWEGSSFTLLRNWPLVFGEKHFWFRLASGLNVVLMATALVATFQRQPRPIILWLAFAFGATLPFANSLVEPRYFIPGAVFTLLFLEMDGTAWRRLAIWWAVLCAVHAPFVAAGRSLW